MKDITGQDVLKHLHAMSREPNDNGPPPAWIGTAAAEQPGLCDEAAKAAANVCDQRLGKGAGHER